MTKTDLNAFRCVLNHQKLELGNSNGAREALAIGSSSDELDRTQDASDRDYAIGNLERNSNRLREVRSALRRVESGTFGICAGCEENINPKRLAAIPWAPFCIACQEAADCEQAEPKLVLAA
ncbi:MAG TPA: TraR/DksA C4-type zinc finger protein [Bryobacteraceae bacterium]|nr:TraR/DksA C4-type zinc finger protein [Bryobacteraceae bacterium]